MSETTDFITPDYLTQDDFTRQLNLGRFWHEWVKAFRTAGTSYQTVYRAKEIANKP